MNGKQTPPSLWDRFFAPPVFPGEEEKTHQARVLHTTVWAIMAIAIVALAGNMLGGRTPTLSNWANIALIGTLPFAYYLIRRGSVNLAGIGGVAVGFLHTTINVAALGTIRAPAAMAYFTVVVVAGLLLGRRGLLFTTALCSFAIFGLMRAENAGWLPSADFTVTITQWVTYTALIGFTANLILTVREISDQSVARTRRELELRKKSEETLKLLSRAVEYNPASIVITDVGGRIVSVNPKFTQLTGYSQEEIRGRNSRILKSGEQSREFYENLWATILAGEIWCGTFHNRKKNGELYWEQASIAPVRNDDDALTHFVAIKEDITARKKAEEDLQKANRTLKRQLAQIEKLQDQLREQVVRDPLTQLYNRRYLEETLEKEHSRSQREKYPVSLIMLDMDNLKSINDAGGHALGDQAICKMAKHLRHCLRGSDTVCRIGGDEFAIIMPKTSARDALRRAEEWNKKLCEVTLLYVHDKILPITFTAGVAAYPDHGKTMEEVLNYADVALYRAKTKGRNRVELFEQ